MSELRDRELRDLLERVSEIDGDVDVDEHWAQGRRRRTRRGAGIAVVTGVAVLTAVGGIAQTGLLGGSDTTPTGPAAVPDSLETFVFAAQGSAGSPEASVELRVPTTGDLAGTAWELHDLCEGLGDVEDLYDELEIDEPVDDSALQEVCHAKPSMDDF